MAAEGRADGRFELTCVAASLAVGEPLAGTAPTAGAWLLYEAGAAWAAKSPRPEDVSGEAWAALKALQAAHGAKLLWVRGGARRRAEVGAEVRAEAGGGAEVGAGGGALLLTRAQPTPQGVALTAPEEGLQALTTRDLWGAHGARPLPAPLFVVCTHGKRDQCCARLGVAVFRALCEVCPSGSVWQSTHLGGHRFAPTLLVLPWGYCYGRLTPDEARDLSAAFATGRLAHLHRLRGRCDAEPPVQAAEVALRQHLGLTRLDAVAHRHTEALGPDRWRVTFDASPDDTRCAPSQGLAVEGWAVEVSSRQDPDLRAPPSCGDDPKPITALYTLKPTPLL